MKVNVLVLHCSFSGPMMSGTYRYLLRKKITHFIVKKKRKENMLCFFRFWRKDILHFGVLLWSLNKLTLRTYSFEGVWSWVRLFYRFKLQGRLSCHLGYMIQETSWHFRVDINAAFSHPQVSRSDPQKGP